MINSNNNVITCTNLTKRFGYFFALKSISFKIKKNTIFGIIGANGAGKTTLIQMLAGLMNPTKGSILIGGKNYKEHPNIIKKMFGTITDKSFLYEELSIHENLKFYDNLHFNFEKDKTNAKIEQYTKLFNLSDWLQEPIRNLSKGMKQKVEIIRVLMHNPSILFLDEPFTGIDFKTVEMLVNIFKDLKEKENLSIILTTHKIDVALQICDDLMILKRGKINKFLSNKDFNLSEIEECF